MLLAALLLASQIAPAVGAPPYRQPQLSAQGTNVGIAYGSGNAIYFARSTDSGKTFGAPVLVSETGRLALGMHRGPRVSYAGPNVVISAIVGEPGKADDGDLLAWRSADGGKTWSTPVRVNDAAGSAREGLHAMAARGSLVVAAWLDLRAEGMRIYGSTSKDGGLTWSRNELVYQSPSGSVCTCCHPSVQVDSSGTIAVMFRNALDGSRDLYVARSKDQGKTFDAAKRVGTGTWKLEACPMDGGGMAIEGDGRLATVWRREQTIFRTDGEGPEKSLGSGRNPAIAAGRKGTYVAWTRDKAVLLAKPGSDTPETLDDAGAFPSVVALGDGSVLAAWESNGAIAIRTIE
jgi:hypothetical protein